MKNKLHACVKDNIIYSPSFVFIYLLCFSDFFFLILPIHLYSFNYLFVFIYSFIIIFLGRFCLFCLMRGGNIETIYYFCASILCEDQLIVVKITQVTVILPQVLVWSATAHSAQEVILPQSYGEVSHWSLSSSRGHSASKLQLIENCS